MRYIFLFLTFSFAAILHVNGDDYTTIQSAIDDAISGDTVLVYNGIYFENVDITKTITLASHAMYDDLETWYEYDPVMGQYVITNTNILNTIIDGSQPQDTLFQSAVLVRSPEDDCISPTVMGFTIQNGMGTMVTEEIETPEGLQTVERMIGGGLFSYLTNADIHHNYFFHNGSPEVQNGGGGYAQTSAEDWSFDNRSSGRPRCDIESISMHDNFYRDNDAIYGNTFSNRGFTDEIDMSNSLFDIYNCPEQNVTGVWVDIEPEAEVEYDGSAGDLCSITDDVWVSPTGSDNTGDASQNNPIRTIKYALEIIAPSDDNPITIHLDEGTYSPSLTNETFSIQMISNVNLIGAGEALTMLDAEQTDRVITMEDCDNNMISELTITGGNADGDYPDYFGGGMYLSNSNPTLTHVTISNNTAGFDGGGLCLYYSNPTLNNVTISNNTIYGEFACGGGMSLYSSNPTLNNVTISNNTADWGGGGMRLVSSNPTLTHVTISNNTAEYNDGGGMELWYSNPTLTNVTISNNTAGEIGGGMILSYSNPTLTHVTISNNTADLYGGGMFLYYSNPTLTNSIIWDNSPQSIYFWNSGDPNSIIINYSDFEGGEEAIVTNDNGEVFWLEGNIDTAPLFTDPDNGDYSLQPNSPCIDAGTAYLELDGEVIIDLDESEYYGTAPDMGAFEYEPLSIEEQAIELPIEYVLHPAYPNPFNPVTTITFGVPAVETLHATSLQVFDITGRQVETLLKGHITPGFHSIEWNAEGYPSGIYFVKLNAGDPFVNSGQGFTQTQKLMLVK